MERDRSDTRNSFQDSGTGVLDELLSYFELEANILDTQTLSHSFTMPHASTFTSAIKFFGQPILPPVMTDERYEEMAMYKRQAIFTETRLKARSRQKLLSRVQNIVDSMHTKKSAPVKSPIRSFIEKGTQLSLDDDTDTMTSLQTSSRVPDSLELEQIPPKVTPTSNVGAETTATKVSPKSEAKDSGFSSSQGPACVDQSELSVVTADPSTEEPQDTMAEITDISDEDPSEDAPHTVPSVAVGARPQTVAQRLGSVFRDDESSIDFVGPLQPQPQSSARSSASCTTSTASTDDTTLQHTVLTQPATVATRGSDQHSDTQQPDQGDLADTTDESIQLADVDTVFEPLSSTRSLLSRVAFNADEDEQVEEDVPAHRIGNLSEIACSVQSQEMLTNPSVGESKDDIEESPSVDQRDVTEQSDREVGPTVTPDLSQIESVPNTLNTRAPQSPVVQDTKTELTGALPAPTTEGATQEHVSPSVNAATSQNTSDSTLDTPESVQNTTDETSMNASTMYSTDIDKYMAGSLDTDTIRSSLTTLPHMLDGSDTDRDTPLVETSRLNPDALVPKLTLVDQSSTTSSSPQSTDQPDTARRQIPLTETSSTRESQSTDTSVPSRGQGEHVRASKELPRPIASYSSPEKSVPSPRDGMIRRGSYTVETPTMKGAVLRRGSYTLASPSSALVNATQNGLKLDQERPKTHLGHTQPVSAKSPPDNLNPSPAQSEPPVISRFELTSSMEDLKLKPVQRTNNFDDDSGSNQTQSLSGKNRDHSNRQQAEHEVHTSGGGQRVPQQPVTVGKEEHLRRYLQTLSQMPQLPPTGANDTASTTTSSTQSSPQAASQTSSPGQVQHHPQHGLVTTGDSAGLTDESLSRSLQIEFESLQAKLLEQQQHQLSQLLVEQQRQQMLMQQEFIKYEALLLQSSGAEHDVLLQQQLQDKQKELVQQQMALQQQLRWQMQQQQLELQDQFRQLKQSQEPPRPVCIRPQLSAGPVVARDKKNTRRKTWKEREQEEPWVLEAQPDDVSVTSENPPQTSQVSGGVSLPVSRLRPHGRYFPGLSNGEDKTEASTDTTISSTYPRTSSQTVNRSGVSLTSDPFSTQRSESVQSAHTDSLAHKKRVSFSTDIDATSEAGSVTSQSTTSFSINRSDPVPPGFYRVGGQLFPTPTIEPVPELAESEETSLMSSGPSSPGRVVGGVYVQSPVSASLSSRISKTSRGSPKSPRRVALTGPKLTIHDTTIPPELQTKFDKVSAAAKGYLTRRLMRSDKVQQIIKTITDTAEFALNFQRESPVKLGEYTQQDRELVERVLAQLTSALYDIHEIFFELPVGERMSLIAQTRAMEKELIFKQKEAKKQLKEKRLSAATLKARERKKKARAAEQAVFGDLRPKSTSPATSSPRAEKRPDLTGPLRRNYQYMMSRVLKPIQAHLSPIKPVKDTLNSNPLRGSYDKMYMRALKRAVAMEKKEQREKKHKTGLMSLKHVKPKVVTGFSHSSKKPSSSKQAAANHLSENQPEGNYQPGNYQQGNFPPTTHTTTTHTTNHSSPNQTTGASKNNTTSTKRSAAVPRPKSALQTHPWK